MKNSRSPRKRQVNLPGSVHQRLTAYALAVGAAGVGAASVQPAQARIVYTPTHHRLTNGTLPIPVDGTHNFNLSDKFYVITGSWSTQLLNINASGSASVVANKGSAIALRKGAVIGLKDKFQSGKELMAGGFCESQISASSVFGPFANTTQRYLGLKFKVNGKVHYGWARFSSVTASACKGGPAVSATLTGYAYETIPGKSIKAGQTKGTDDSPGQANPAAITAPTLSRATLGLLSLGSSGLSAWRRDE